MVTVPAHFNQAQQGATHSAAQQAGIATVQLLQVGGQGSSPGVWAQLVAGGGDD